MRTGREKDRPESGVGDELESERQAWQQREEGRKRESPFRQGKEAGLGSVQE